MTAVIQVRQLTKVYPLRGRRAAGAPRDATVRAVDGVDLEVGVGETLALVGESGSGKTTTGKIIARLEKPTSGSVLFEGADLARAGGRELRQARRHLQMIFQDPYESLDPRYTIGMSIEEPLRALTDLDAAGRRRRVEETLDLVELGPSSAYFSRYPHELSGGQRQRVAIARAIVVGPRFVVADEPVSMLDVSIRAGILELLRRLQRETSISYLFITHDLAVARHMAARIAVMYAGRIVEVGAADRVIQAPRHPYTRLLMSSVTRIDGDMSRRPVAPPSMPDAPTTGCSFAARCPFARSVCVERAPLLLADPRGTQVACHAANEGWLPPAFP